MRAAGRSRVELCVCVDIFDLFIAIVIFFVVEVRCDDGERERDDAGRLAPGRGSTKRRRGWFERNGESNGGE